MRKILLLLCVTVACATTRSSDIALTLPGGPTYTVGDRVQLTASLTKADSIWSARAREPSDSIMARYFWEAENSDIVTIDDTGAATVQSSGKTKVCAKVFQLYIQRAGHGYPFAYMPYDKACADFIALPRKKAS